MRIAVISDVHGNRLALEAVLADIEAHGVDMTLNLGDMIPVPQTTFVGIATGGVQTQPQVSYQYRPVGVNISITPKVTYNDEIILDPITVAKDGLGQNIDVAGQSLPTFVTRAATRKAAHDLLTRFTRLVRHPLEPDVFERYWHFAALTIVEGALRPDEAEPFVERALERFPDEPRFLGQVEDDYYAGWRAHSVLARELAERNAIIRP